MDSLRPLEPRTPGRGRAVVAVLLALTIAGCGGSPVDYQEVPGDPAEITLPDRSPAPTATPADSGADAAGEQATPAPTATPGTGAATGGTTGTEPPTAEATPAPAGDGPTTDEPPVPGSDAQRFEDFCEQNAGAC